MAQRTGAERFLALPVKSTSARVSLALVLAALALAGCGGDSSDQEAASSGAASSGAEGPPGASTTTAKGKDGAQPGSGPKSPGGGPEGGSPGAAAQGGGKQGQRIVQPTGPREPEPTPAEIANATVADMTLQSPAIIASGGNPGSLSPVYSCDGKDIWPALSWSGVPAGTAELALYLMNVQPVAGKLFVDWAVSGLDPGLSSIEAGKLPPGAVVGENSFGKRGYSICPAGRGEIYMFALYALPERIGLRPGFDARTAREQILEISGNVGLLPALYAHS